MRSTLNKGGTLEIVQPIPRFSLRLRPAPKQTPTQQPVHNEALAAFNRITKHCSLADCLQDGLETALEQAAQVVGLEAGAVFLLTGNEDLKPAAQLGLSPAFIESSGHSKAGDFFTAEATPQREPLVVTPKKSTSRGLRLIAASEKLQTIVLTPLISNGGLRGVLLLGSHELREIKPEALQFLETLGSQLGLIVENSILRASAEKAGVPFEKNHVARSLHDSVTQTLFSASLIADVLPVLLEQQPEEARDRLEELRRLNRGALAEMYLLIGALSGW